MNKRWKFGLMLIGIFYFTLLFLSPISGDDWGNALLNGNFIDSIDNAFRMYFTWEGRIVSRILINVLTPNKMFWNIVNSFSICLFVYLSIKMVKPKNNSIYYLTLLVIPLMNFLTFSEVITFVAGNLTYFIEIPFILLYFSFLFSDRYGDSKSFLFLCILGAMICMTVEHMAAVMVIGSIILLVYVYFKNRHVDKKLVVLSLICFVTTLLMYLSPGSQYRLSIENVEFNRLSIFGKIGYNIPSFIYYTFIVNYYLLVLWIISNYFMIRNRIRRTSLKVFLIFLFSIVPVITIFIYFKSMVSKDLFINNIYLSIYYILFLLGSFIFNVMEKDFKSTFLFIIGICANTLMLLSPTWGYRTSLFTYIMLCLSNIIIISKYLKDNRIISLMLKVVFVLILFIYLFIYINVYRCERDNEKFIKEQLYDNKDSIEILRYPYFVNCNINPSTDYHKMVYKRYFNIPEDKELILVDKWKYQILYKK